MPSGPRAPTSWSSLSKIVNFVLTGRMLHKERTPAVGASVLMQRRSYPTETVLSNKTNRNRTVLSFKDSPRKPLGRRPSGYITSIKNISTFRVKPDRRPNFSSVVPSRVKINFRNPISLPYSLSLSQLASSSSHVCQRD